MWEFGRVTQLSQGRDGKVRSDEVHASAGTTLRRPLQASEPYTPSVEDSRS